MSYYEKRGCSTLSGFIKGVILGGLIGAGIAALFTPQSGEETRRQLKKKGRELEKKTKRLLEDTVENWDENKEILKKKIGKISSAIEEKADDLSSFLGEEKVRDVVSSAKKSFHETRENLEDAWSKRFAPPSVGREEGKKREPVKEDSDEVELARRILSRAASRSFYRKAPRK